MATKEHPHEELIKHAREDFAEIFTKSPQGVFIYMDDPHWTCNDKLATMLGYDSADELLKTAAKSSLLDALVAPESLERVPAAYFKASDGKTASSVDITWKKKDGSTLKTQVIFAPFSIHGNTMVLHYVTPL